MSIPILREVSTLIPLYLAKRHADRGITLIELILALAIVGIIMTGIFAFYSYGTRSFATGRDRAQMQQNLRAAAELITSEVRYATEMERLASYSDLPLDCGNVAPGDSYIYLDQDTGSIMHLDTVAKRAITEGLFTDLSFYNNGRVFKFTIQSGFGEDAIVFETELLLVNTAYIQSYPDSIPAIRYRKP